MQALSRFPIALSLLAMTAAAQDHVWVHGFSDANGPAAGAMNSHPAARVKDSNLDGVIQVPDELHTFLSTCFHTTGGICFMTDVRSVVVDGELEFYFTDSEQGRVVRGVDSNHNGLLDRGEDINGNGILDVGEDTNGNLILDTEVSEFFFFGVTTATFAPDSLDVHHDPVSGQTRVYVAIDNNIGAFARGIHKLVDLNGDGDAKDPGEQSVFVNSSIPLMTPTVGGPLPNFWSQVRALPNGKIVAYASGLAVPAAGPFSLNENAFYGFTDNGGPSAATVEIWLNCSVLNSLPLHPDWASGTFPVWDIDYIDGVTPRRRTFARWLAVAERGGTAGAVPAYYIASSYTWGTIQAPPAYGDININGEHVSGLIYRVNDLNLNGSIDAGELTLWANMSGATYAGVAPATFTDIVSLASVGTLTDRTWAVDATDDGEFTFFYSNAGADAIVKMSDQTFDNVISTGEIDMVYATTAGGGGFPPPFNPTLGPYMNPHHSLEDGLMPGPFPVGVQVSGQGCYAPTRGLNVLMDSWGGSPSVGNPAFALGCIRATPGFPALMALGNALLPGGPVSLVPFGFPAGCTLDILNPQTFGFAFSDAHGRIIFGAGIPNDPGLIGQSVAFQAGVADTGSPVPVQFHTTNAMLLTIQP